jgi:3-phenylpropionate/trans-cinnamate dioxygenase ferredoxin reductase component
MLQRMREQIVIVGAGQAAVQAVDTLRRKGFTGKLVLVGEETWIPYQRPPLSKKYLAGTLERDRLPIRPPHFYPGHQVELRLGRRAVEISRIEQRVRLDDGSTVAYDGLLLATGSKPRGLAVPGIELGGVHYLRTLDDVDRIRADLAPGRRLVVVGGGYIGLEVAATARELGLEVTVLEMADRVMNRVTCSQLSAFYQGEHSRRGVKIVCDARVAALAGGNEGRVRAVVTEDGAEHPADVVVVGVGVVAVDELAAAAGLDCANGIVVDTHCRTSDTHIYAAGDCTSHPSLHYARRLRLESVDNAFEQAGSAALNLMDIPTVHDRIPWFWSDQFDLKLVIVGLCQDHDAVVTRGDAGSRSFSACYLREGELVAIDTVNHPKDQMAARKLIAARARPNPDKLADPAMPLKDSV